MNKQLETATSFKEAYINMIRFNENCINEGKLAIEEANTLENREYSSQVQKAITSSTERIMTENKMYSILLKQKDYSDKNNKEVSDQLQIITIVLNKYVRPEEIKAWEGSVLVAQGKNLSDYESKISIGNILAFVIIFILFYTYAKTKIEEKENKNN